MTLLRPRSGIRIRATGSYLPERRVTTAALAARPHAPLTEAEILRLTGIEERHFAAPEQATSDLAAAAGRQILQRAGDSPPSAPNAGRNPQSAGGRSPAGNGTPDGAALPGNVRVDRVVVSTSSPDHPSPATACRVQHLLGLAPAAAADLSAACAGFLFALDWGARAVLTGDERVLVLAADIRSRFVNFDDRATFALFGDGAGGVLLEPGPEGEGLLGLYLAADGEGFDTLKVPAGGSRMPASAETVANHAHCLVMEDGPRVFLTAVEGMADAAEGLLRQLDVEMDDIALIVPHQPNRMILTRLARYMRLPVERFFINVEKTGNMSSASLAVAFDHAMSGDTLKPGDLVLLVGGGAGYCVGAALVRIPESTP